MNTHKFLHLIFLILLLGLGSQSCRQRTPVAQEKTSPEKAITTVKTILIEVEQFVESEGTFTVGACAEGGEQLLAPEGEGWLSYDVKVPTAGRYSCEIRAYSEEDSVVSFWVEDYIDNPDGRTYNITGNMELPAGGKSDEFQTLKKDGTPLNVGLHKMKLHVGKGRPTINWVKFTLIRPHTKTPVTLTQKTEGEKWEIVWSDEFEGTGPVDESKWTYDVGDWGWGNNELQYYTVQKPKNARVEDGNLIIEAHKNDGGNKWTSARLTTRGKKAFLYGRIEFRAKAPANKGNWAAGWTLGDNYVDEKSWPYCGEIDIMESVGFEMDNATGNGEAHSTIHCGEYYFKKGNQPTGIVDVKNMNNEFHTYGIDWTPEGIKGYVDGKYYFSYDDTSTDLAWPFGIQPQNIILNLAMGGGWGGAQGMDETMTSQKLIIDYVRVYELR